MKLTIFCAVTFLISCLATTTVWEISFQGRPSSKSRFYVLNNWDKEGGVYIKSDHTPFPAEEVSNIMLKTMGIFREGVSWSGVSYGNLFRRPRATALFLINALSDTLDFEPLSTQSYNVDQIGLTGIPSEDSSIMFNDDNIMTHFQKLFDGQSLSKTLSASHSLDENNRLQHIDNSFIPDGIFDLNCPVDAKFVQELQSIKVSVDMLPVAAVNDGAPDTYQFIFSSLTGLQIKYTAKSKQMTAALNLVHDIILQVTEKLNKLYNDDIVIQALVLQWQYPEITKEEVNGIRIILENHFTKEQVDEITANLPLLKLPKMTADTRTLICDGLRYYIDIDNGKLESNCPHSFTSSVRLRRDLTEYEETDNSTIYKFGNLKGLTEDRTDNFPAIFLIIFVTVVPLALALYAISWGMWNMDPGRDSVIYRNTDPVGIKLE